MSEELLVEGTARWAGAPVELQEAPGAGRSSQVVFVRTGERELVLRLAPDGPPLFPDADLGREVTVMRTAAAAGLPVPEAELVEDPSFVGRAFVAMPRVRGRHVGEVPTQTAWLVGLDEDEQRAVQSAFLDVLAALHRVPVEPFAAVLRGGGLAAEVAWWRRYAEWIGGGGLLGLFDRCAEARPPTEPPPSVLWGDVRLGNVVFDAAGPEVAGVLDWEMASIGPAESDLAWFTALSAMTERFFGERVPGFADRDGIVAHHEAALGRPMQDFAWHEAFALARSAAVLLRSEGPGADLDGHFIIGFTAKQLTRLLGG